MFEQLSHLHERLRPTSEQLLDLESRGCVVERGRWSPLNYDRLKANVEEAKKVHVNIFDHYTKIRGDRLAHEAFARLVGKGINRTLASVVEKFQRDYGEFRYIDERSRKINDDFAHLEAYVDDLIEKNTADPK